MLLSFSFENYGSFHESATLDLRATNYTDHEDFVLNKGKERILPVAAIYGANASGKSTVIDAFYTLRNFVTRSATFSNDSSDLAEKTDGLMKYYKPFLLSEDSPNQPVSFICTLLLHEVKYTLSFAFNAKAIVFEELVSKNTKPYSRDRVVYRIKDGKFEQKSKSISALSNLFEGIDNTSLFITFLGLKGDQEIATYCAWFSAANPFDWTKHCDDERYLKRTSRVYDKNEGIMVLCNKIIPEIDPCIQSVDLKAEEAIETEQKEMNYMINVNHHMGKSTVTFPLRIESGGTKKVYLLCLQLYFALKRGEICILDELDARLHPMVIEYILSLFHNQEENTGMGQLIFTTHNPVMLNHRKMRRDEIWFTEKDMQGQSKLYSLADIDGVRFDADFETNYLRGNYGAVPFSNRGDDNE